MGDAFGIDRAAAARRRLAAAGIRHGAMRHGWDRPVKNGHWYALALGVAARVGTGDLTTANLRAAGPALGDGWAFVVLPEHPLGWPLDPDPPLVTELAAGATFVVLDGQLSVVDRPGLPSEAGTASVSPGYRLARAGRLRRARPVRLPVVAPGVLAGRLVELVGADLRTTDVTDLTLSEGGGEGS